MNTDMMIDREHFSDHSRRQKNSWTWVLTAGILVILCGFLAISAPVITGIGFTVLLGSVLVVAGVFHTAQALKNRHEPGFGSQLFTSTLALIAGIVFLFNPIEGLMSLGIFMTAYLFASGLFRVFYSLQLRPVIGWGWMLTGGLITTLLASALWMQLPLASLLIIGVIIGIDLVTLGSIQIMLALQQRTYQKTLV